MLSRNDTISMSTRTISATVLALLIFSLGFIFKVQAQGFGEAKPDDSVQINQNPLKITGTELSPNTIEPGGVSELKVLFQLDTGYRAYLDQFAVEVKKPKDVFLTEFQVLPVSEFRDPVTKKQKLGVKGAGSLTTLVQLPSNFSAGTKKVSVELTYQACTDEFCLFPTRTTFEFDLVVEVGATSKDDFFSRALAKGWLSALLFVFIAGILTSFTPCIFPLIPITLAVIGSRDAGSSKLRGAVITFSYVFGIALTYSILGVIAAKTGALFGGLLGHPIVVAGIAGLFVLMGLSMYGLFELKFPDRWAGKLLGNRTERGILGAFLSGLIAGVVASPCVGPVLVSILAYVAQTQDTVRGFVYLFVFAFGLGQVFLVLGTFSQLLHKLPKSGPWMDNIKFVFGTTMIGMALFYVYPVAHSTLFDGLIATALILIGTFFGAFERLNRHGSSGRPKNPDTGSGDRSLTFGRLINQSRRILMLLVFFVGWVFAVKAFLPSHIEDQFLRNTDGRSVMDTYAKPDWSVYSDSLLQTAASSGRPVILDFKADWCLACKELEMYTFSDQRVLEKGKDILWLSFDATKDSAELAELRAKYNIPGLPAVLFFDASGKWREDLSLFGFEDAQAFLARMGKM